MLMCANNQRLDDIGQTKLTVNFGKHSFEHMVKVVDLDDNSTILGLDFMEMEDCGISMKSGLMKIPYKDIRIQLHRLNGNN